MNNTQKKAAIKRHVKHWRDRFELNGWSIWINFVDDASGEYYGTSEANTERNEARLTFNLTMDEIDIEGTVLHEMAHLRLWRLHQWALDLAKDNEFATAAIDAEVEKIIAHLERGLLET